MSNTVFDDTFKTIIEKMPELVIPMVNEVFGKSYSYKEKITKLLPTNCLLMLFFPMNRNISTPSQLLNCKTTNRMKSLKRTCLWLYPSL